MGRTVVVGGLLLVLLLSISEVCLAQPGGAPNQDEGVSVSRYRDAVHWAGIIGTCLAVLVALGGLTILLGFNIPGKPWNDPTRARIRAIHMTGGVTAITLGLTHYIGRCVQLDELVFEPIPPVYAMACFLVVLTTGILRFRTPQALRKHYWVLAWIHRLAAISAIYFAARHALYQMSRFVRD